MERLDEIFEPLLLAGCVSPPLLDDLRLAVPTTEQVRDRCRTIKLPARHAHLRSELPRRLLNIAARVVIDRRRQVSLELCPESFERFPRNLGIGTIDVAWRKLDVLVPADDRKRGLQIVWTNAGREQIEHVAIAGGSRVGDEVAPRPVAKLLVLHLVQLSEAWRDAR